MEEKDRIIYKLTKQMENTNPATLSKCGGNDLLRPSAIAERRRKEKELEEKRIRDMIRFGLLK